MAKDLPAGHADGSPYLPDDLGELLWSGSFMALSIEDWSGAKARVDALVRDGITDLGAYLRENTAELTACVEGLRRVAVNPAHAELFGLPAEDQQERSVRDAVGDANIEAPLPALIAIAAGRTTFEHESYCQKSNGEPIWVLVRWLVLPRRQADYDRVLVQLTDITDARRAREALGESEERYRILVEQSPDNVIVIQGETIVFANAIAARAVGAEDPGEIIGRPMTDFCTPEWIEQARRRIAAAIADGQPLKATTADFRRLDGSKFAVEMVTAPLTWRGQPAVQIVSRDLTERLEAEKALRESERRYRAVIESAPLGMHFYILDDEGRLVFVGGNPAADDVLGIDHSELTGKTIEEAWPRLVDTPVPDIYRRIAAHGGSWHSDDLEYEERGRLVGSFDVRAFQTAPNAVGVMFAEISDRKRAEEELAEHREHLEQLVRERTAELEDTNARLESATKAKSDFLAAVSHELRTPLNSIIGFSGILLQGLPGALNAEQQRQVEMINHSGRQLLSLIGDVLDLTRIESGRVEVHAAELNPGEFAREVVESVRPLADAQGLELRLSIDEAPARITVDREKLEQIMLNLLSNAIKYTEHGWVEVAVREADGGTQLQVSDTGCGIPESAQGRIFEEFHQVTRAGSVKPPGTGLGLAITRRLVGALNGWIQVQSAVDQGSTFTVWLPGNAAREDSPASTSPQPPPER
jgi:PAS domain S-box-containing protein